MPRAKHGKNRCPELMTTGKRCRYDIVAGEQTCWQHSPRFSTTSRRKPSKRINVIDLPVQT